MSFKLRSEIIFTKLSNGEKSVFKVKGGVNDLKITRSTVGLKDTAILKLPSIGRVLSNDNLPNTSIESANFFSYGDQIEIKLGYNDDLRTEFKGFILKVLMSTPILIECEGYSFQLYKKVVKNWKETTVSEVLEFLVSGTDIKVSDWSKSQTIKLKNFSIATTGLEVLSWFAKKMGLTACFLFDEVYVGLQQIPKLNEVKLRLGWNVLRDDKLETIENRKVLVRVFFKDLEGIKRKVELGDKSGQLIELKMPYIKDLATIYRIAENKFEVAKSQQIKGAITCFLQPYIQPFDLVSIIDKRYERRSGKYFVTATEVTFGMNGARRKIGLGTKLN